MHISLGEKNTGLSGNSQPRQRRQAVEHAGRQGDDIVRVKIPGQGATGDEQEASTYKRVRCIIALLLEGLYPSQKDGKGDCVIA